MTLYNFVEDRSLITYSWNTDFHTNALLSRNKSKHPLIRGLYGTFETTILILLETFAVGG